MLRRHVAIGAFPLVILSACLSSGGTDIARDGGTLLDARAPASGRRANRRLRRSLSPGLVQDELSSGLPQLVESPGEQACEPDATIEGYPGLTAFDDWFSDGDGRETYERELVLYPDHDGSYVNRSGEGGEQWVGYEGEEWAEDGYFTCSWCLDGDCNDPCSGETTLYDGNPLFFPLDDISSVAHPAKVPAAYLGLVDPIERLRK